jgi:hypothetical protein
MLVNTTTAAVIANIAHHNSVTAAGCRVRPQ